VLASHIIPKRHTAPPTPRPPLKYLFYHIKTSHLYIIPLLADDKRDTIRLQSILRGRSLRVYELYQYMLVRGYERARRRSPPLSSPSSLSSDPPHDKQYTQGDAGDPGQLL
jgi:hypothetical protein